MEIQKAKLVLSCERMSTYEKIAQQYSKDPMKLYLLNVQVSASFHFTLHMCEVMLRNAIDRTISTMFTSNWHTNPQFHRIIDKYHRNKLFDSIKKNANRKTGNATKCGVIADLTLGFWVNLLSPKYTNLWTNRFYKCFINYKELHPLSNNPVNALSALYNQLKKLNKFRNRIAHYEPIINNNLLTEYMRILNIIKCIDTDCAKWVQAKQRTIYYIKRINDYII
jgi:hypothetical protein